MTNDAAYPKAYPKGSAPHSTGRPLKARVCVARNGLKRDFFEQPPA